MKLVAIVGLCGSGKSEVTKMFEEAGYQRIYFGELTFEKLKEKGLAINEQNEKMVREELRCNYGAGAYAILNISKIKSALERGKVVIESLYSWSEYKIIKEMFKEEFKVVAISAPPEVRYNRLSNREVRPLITEVARSRDFAQIENIQQAGPIAMADYTIVNDGLLEELKQKVKNIISI